MAAYQLAQVNIAYPRAPLDSEMLAGFVSALDPVNALADDTPGFVWRLQTEDGNATAVRAFDDDRLIVNMSVWESVEALAGFVYKHTGHVEVLRQRKKWFERIEEAYMVLWWVPAGHIPTVEEAEGRLNHLRARGPTPTAFTFKHRFSSPAREAAVEQDDGWFCPA